ncbi:MAG: hypothetical protein Q8Q35_02500, partial [Nanoarchaeota archaeon]|nr:hypothetical protein [Nanoarchaeota archaeon]
FAIVKRGLYEVINLEAQENIEDYIEKTTRIIISELDLRITEQTMEKVLYHIFTDFIGLGKIEAILKDPFITEIKFENSIQVKHNLYGNLNTDIMLNDSDLNLILRKLALHCHEDLSNLQTELTCTEEDRYIEINYKPESIMESTFKITKQTIKYLSPVELALQRKLTPEILAFLWLLIEDKKAIFISKDTAILNSLSFFLPPHSKVLTNIKDYQVNPFTITLLGESSGEEDYALIDNYKDHGINGSLIASTENIIEEGNIVCYIDKGKISSIKENGIILFQEKEGKYYYNLEPSTFMTSRGNKTILMEEFTLRTKLLLLLIRNNQNPSDFRKVIKIYYETPVAVLKRAGLI